MATEPRGRHLIRMRRLAALLAATIAAWVPLAGGGAEAQTDPCSMLLVGYAGRPLAQALAGSGNPILADYFGRKLQLGGAEATFLSPQDLNSLALRYQQSGRTACDLLRDVDRIASAGGAPGIPSPPPAPVGMGAPPPSPLPAAPIGGGAPPPLGGGSPSPLAPAIQVLGVPAAPSSTPTGVSFTGGWVRKTVVTQDNPTPPPGFGLYTYILPQSGVDPGVLNAIDAFYRCLHAPGAGDSERTVALMIVPVWNAATPRIDLQLAHDLARTAIADDRIDPREVYVLATNTPLLRNLRYGPAQVTPILLGRVAPEYVATWLDRLKSLIEQGRIESPPALALKARSLLVEVNAIGSLIGVTPANAAPYGCP